MSVKPDWMKQLEERQTNKLLVTNQTSEISASHARILNEDAPKMWDRITNRLYDALSSCQIQGITSVFEKPTTDIVHIQIFRKNSALPAVFMFVQFFPENQEIRSGFRVPLGPHLPRVFRFTVSGGRVSLMEGAEVLPDNGDDLADIVCQRLLQPVLETLI